MRVGPYEVTAQIGVGGMGEVYRATDTKLKRQVALKVLPDALAGNPERLARFQREAEVLAALNHPHIAQIYGLEESDGVKALVMELVDGPTLAERIAQGALPVDDALAIARQMADALEAAHERGIIHRDLKPANIKVREDGTVKVLDFGLAKAMDPAGAAPPGVSQLPTITSPALMTGAGMILGTAAYMSPEQARGKAVDKRADIWAFGCVLHEMLTGRRSFEGESVTETLAAVLRAEPRWEGLPSLEPSVEFVLRRCFRKEPRDRTPDAAMLRMALSGELRPLTSPSGSGAAGQNKWILPTGVLAAVLGAAVGILTVDMIPPAQWPAPVWTTVILPGLDHVAISPDGDIIVRPAGDRLVLKRLSRDGTASVPNSDGAAIYPFFSPDGLAVGFGAAGGGVARVLNGGQRVRLGSGTVYGSAWRKNGHIVFGINGRGLVQVSEDGGDLLPLTTVRDGELDHRSPDILPDADHAVFTIWRGGQERSSVGVVDLRTGEVRDLLRGIDPQYVVSGHLLFVRDGGLWAVGFDPQRLAVSGDPKRILEGVYVQEAQGTASFDVSDDGTLVFVRSETGDRSLVWVDRQGREEAIPIEPGYYWYPRLSPKGDRIAVDDRKGGRNIWVWDVARRSRQKLALGDGGGQYPVWSPDASRIVYDNNMGGIEVTTSNGTGRPVSILESLGGSPASPYFITPDESAVGFRRQGGANDDIGLVTMSGRDKPVWLLNSAAFEENASLSSDGRWIAYSSNQSGQPEVYVSPFPNAGDSRTLVSTKGGRVPLWSRDQRELFYLVPGSATLMSVPVKNRGTSLSFGAPETVMTWPYVGLATGRQYDVSLDSRRFLAVSDQPARAFKDQVVVVQNFFTELKRLVPTKGAMR